MRLTIPVLLIAAMFFGVGCLPRVVVRPNPGPRTQGIRYYRPKPYLKLAPYEQTVTTTTTTTTEDKKKSVAVTGLADQYVSISLEYLPDFAEEYAIDIRSGLGKNKTELTLDKGWNLTQINQDLDSQTDENITAVANLLKSIPMTAKGTDSVGQSSSEVQYVVRATNVPLGYYESVWGYHCGKKQLYGWRYIGFMPYSPCPVCITGMEPASCQTEPIYGLVFDNGVMTFRLLSQVAQLGHCQNHFVKPATGVPASPIHLPSAEYYGVPAGIDPVKCEPLSATTQPSSYRHTGEQRPYAPPLSR